MPVEQRVLRLRRQENRRCSSPRGAPCRRGPRRRCARHGVHHAPRAARRGRGGVDCRRRRAPSAPSSNMRCIPRQMPRNGTPPAMRRAHRPPSGRAPPWWRRRRRTRPRPAARWRRPRGMTAASSVMRRRSGAASRARRSRFPSAVNTAIIRRLFPSADVAKSTTDRGHERGCRQAGRGYSTPSWTAARRPCAGSGSQAWRRARAAALNDGLDDVVRVLAGKLPDVQRDAGVGGEGDEELLGERGVEGAHHHRGAHRRPSAAGRVPRCPRPPCTSASSMGMAMSAEAARCRACRRAPARTPGPCTMPVSSTVWCAVHLNVALAATPVRSNRPWRPNAVEHVVEERRCPSPRPRRPCRQGRRDRSMSRLLRGARDVRNAFAHCRSPFSSCAHRSRDALPLRPRGPRPYSTGSPQRASGTRRSPRGVPMDDAQAALAAWAHG